MEKTSISVCMITYNQEKFIEQAIQGVLHQKTNFNIEFVIANDSSKDKSHEIISRLAKNINRITFKYFMHDQNLGMIPNFIFALKKCNSKYIAICEGDDYWTDPLKLQKQADFLENTPDAVGCFHNSICVDEQSNVIDNEYFKKTNKRSYTQEECLKELHSSYSTASLVFKASAIKHQLNEYSSIISDFILDLLITNHGKLYYIDENMSAYRLHSGGIWQGNTDLYNHKVVLERYLFLFNQNEFKKKYNKYLWSIIMEYYQLIIENINDPKELKEYKKKQLHFLNYFECRTYVFLYKKIRTLIRYRLKSFKK